MERKLKSKKRRIAYVVERVSAHFEKDGYTSCRATSPMGMTFFESNKLIDENYGSVLSLCFEDDYFSLLYAVEPVMWLSSMDAALKVSNFECSFRINLWEVARYFQPELFGASKFRELTLLWKLFESEKQLEEAISDLLSCHIQLYPKYFGQFEFPQPLIDLSIEDIKNQNYKNKLFKLGLRMNVEFARQLADFLISLGQAKNAEEFYRWADMIESED